MQLLMYKKANVYIENSEIVNLVDFLKYLKYMLTLKLENGTKVN